MRKLDIDEQKVLNLYEEHETARAVAEIVGCSADTVYRVLKKHDVSRTHRHPKVTTKRVSNCGRNNCWALVVMLRNICHMSYSELIAATGYSRSVVNNIICKRCPETKVARRHKDDFDIERMVHEYRDLDMTSYELGEKYDVLPSTICRWMRSEGVCKGKNNGISQAKSREAAVKRFVDGFPDAIESCNTWRDRAYVRRKHRILSRPHDKGCNGIKWQEVAKRDGLVCWICGKPCIPGSDKDDCPSVDHVIPIYKGGTDTFDNVRIAHRGCNRDRSNKPRIARR